MPAVTVTRADAVPGGAGNLAANLAALGATRRLLAVIGDDDAGRRLLHALAAAGVDDAHLVTEPGRRTVVKRRLVAEGQLVARFDEGDRTPPGTTPPATSPAPPDSSGPGDAVVVSDYGYGVVGEASSGPSPRSVAGTRPVLVVDAHDPGALAALRPTAVTPSFSESRAPAPPAGQADATGPGTRRRRSRRLRRPAPGHRRRHRRRHPRPRRHRRLRARPPAVPHVDPSGAPQPRVRSR